MDRPEVHVDVGSLQARKQVPRIDAVTPEAVRIDLDAHLLGLDAIETHARHALDPLQGTQDAPLEQVPALRQIAFRRDPPL